MMQMEVVASDAPVMDMMNCVVRIHRLDLPLDVVVKVPVGDEECGEESASSSVEGRSLPNSIHAPVQEAEKMEVVASDAPVMDMINCVVRIHRLDLPLDGVVKVPMREEERWTDWASSEKENLTSSVFSQELSETEDEEDTGDSETEKSRSRSGKGTRRCIVSGCNALVAHLPRHLRRVHEWSPQEAISAEVRPTRKCIMKGCTAVVVHLTRHLRQVHHFGPSEAQIAVLRSREKPRSQPSQRKQKLCPQKGCGRWRRNIYQHMKKFHKLEKGPTGWRTISKWNINPEFSRDGSVGLDPTPSPACAEEGTQQEEAPEEDAASPNSPSRSNTDKESNTEVKAWCRETKKCIISGCTAVVIHLPRHLRQVHQWNPPEARDAVQSLRKPCSPTSRPMKKCPVEGCGRMTQRVPQHLRSYHKLQIGSLQTRKIREPQVELDELDRSTQEPGAIESAELKSLEFSDSGNGELHPSCSPPKTYVEEEGAQEEPTQQDTLLCDNPKSPSSSNADKESNAEVKAWCRGTKSCIVSGCTAVVIHLPRHLRQVHQWNPQEARKATICVRKPYSPTSRPMKKCPVEGCGHMTRGVPQHLRKHHKLEIGSLERHNIREPTVDLGKQDGSVDECGVVESSKTSSSGLSDSTSGELPPLSPTTSSTGMVEGQHEESSEQGLEHPNNQNPSSITEKESTAEIKAHGRGSRGCIISGCKAVVIHLPRHLREVHQWNPQEARDAAQSLRKACSPTSHPMKKCPVEGCGRMTQRVPQHLRKYHKLEIGFPQRRKITEPQVELDALYGLIQETEDFESGDLKSDSGSGELPPSCSPPKTYVEEEEGAQEEPTKESALLCDRYININSSEFSRNGNGLDPTPSSACAEDGTQQEEALGEDAASPNSPSRSNAGKESNTEIKAHGRGSRGCIISGCKAVVIHLPRHLREVHQWNPQEARDAAQSLRKACSPTSRPMKKCPVEGCGRMTQRVPQHLRKYHKLEISFPQRRKITEPQVELDTLYGLIQETEDFESADFKSLEFSDSGSGGLPPSCSPPKTYVEEGDQDKPTREELTQEDTLLCDNYININSSEFSRDGSGLDTTTYLAYAEDEKFLRDESGGMDPTPSPVCAEDETQQEEAPEEDAASPNSPSRSNTDKESNTEVTAHGRGSKSCIVSGCTAVVIHLPRHLRQVHQWNPQEARDAAQSLRKACSPTSRPMKKCPVEGCGRMTQRVPQHLRKYHKLEIVSQARSSIQDDAACGHVPIF